MAKYRAIYGSSGKLAEFMDGELVWSSEEYFQNIANPAHLVIPELPSYQSPVTGLWVDGRAARRNDLARTNSRPWEGLEAERKEAARQEAYQEKKYERDLSVAAQRAWAQLDPDKRRLLREH